LFEPVVVRSEVRALTQASQPASRSFDRPFDPDRNGDQRGRWGVLNLDQSIDRSIQSSLQQARWHELARLAECCEGHPPARPRSVRSKGFELSAFETRSASSVPNGRATDRYGPHISISYHHQVIKPQALRFIFCPFVVFCFHHVPPLSLFALAEAAAASIEAGAAAAAAGLVFAKLCPSI
jgi:hypothetical protein